MTKIKNLIKTELRGKDVKTQNIISKLNERLKQEFKETNNRGLIKKYNQYFQVKITRIRGEEIDGDYEKITDVSLLELEENPLEGLSVGEYLVKSFHLDNEYLPTTNGLPYNPGEYSLAHLMNYYLENHTKEGYSPRIIGIDTIDERTQYFTISFGSKGNKPVIAKFRFTVDNERKAGSGFTENNGVIGREPFYAVRMLLLEEN